MRILGIESSSLVASVAVVTDGVVTAEYTVNIKKTHSQTLLPMLDEIVRAGFRNRRRDCSVRRTGIVYRSPYRFCHREGAWAGA